MLEALARVFGLDAAATGYLLSFAAPRPGRSRDSARRARARRHRPASVCQLLAAINLQAFVESRMFDVLAANDLATALSPGMFLVLYHAAPGSESARALARLAIEDQRELSGDERELSGPDAGGAASGFPA